MPLGRNTLAVVVSALAFAQRPNAAPAVDKDADYLACILGHATLILFDFSRAPGHTYDAEKDAGKAYALAVDRCAKLPHRQINGGTDDFLYWTIRGIADGKIGP